MSLKSLVKSMMVAALVLTPLAAEEVDKAAQCDQSYETCLKKCDEAENASEMCYETCDKTYESCLQSAQQTPES